MYPFPPRHCIASIATSTARSDEYRIAPAQSYRNVREMRGSLRSDHGDTHPPADLALVARFLHSVHVRAGSVQLSVHVRNLGYNGSTLNLSAARETRAVHTLHQLELSNRLAKLFPIMHILDCYVERSLHEPVSAVNQCEYRWETDVNTYPRGPPLSTSRARSRPDMRTFAPPFTGPSTFSGACQSVS